VNGGTLTPGGVTDASGIATATWTLGAGGGAQTATASLAGATGSPVTFTATSPVVPTITVAPGGALVFSPVAITISAGQSVHFVWATGATNHNVSPDIGNPSALPASPGLPALLDAPQSFSVTFPAAGTFKFFCSAHGANPSAGTVNGMSGTVTVN
jgi:plastocyanin